MTNENLLDFYGFEYPDTGTKSSTDDQLKLLRNLRPQPAPCPLIRIGPGTDGTYIVPDDLTGIAACFSPGTDNFKDFEDALTRQYGIDAHMCDGANEEDDIRTSLIDGKQTFEKLWLETEDTQDCIRLDSWVARHQPNPENDLMLQMDIEGAEYRNILACSDETLKRFRIIVIEVHGLEKIVEDSVLQTVFMPFFERLLKHHTCIHTHPNNYFVPFYLPELGVSVPPLLELTFLRNDRFESRDLFEVQLPHPFDIRRNIEEKPPVFLDDFFRGRPPSEREAIQMLEGKSSWQLGGGERRVEERFTSALEKVVLEAQAVGRERDLALAEKGAALAERDAATVERDAALAERDIVIAQRDAALAERDTTLAERNATLVERDAAVRERDSYKKELTSVIRHPWKHTGKFFKRRKR